MKGTFFKHVDRFGLYAKHTKGHEIASVPLSLNKSLLTVFVADIGDLCSVFSVA